MPDDSAPDDAAMQRHMDTMRRDHGQHLWLPLACVALGLWLASSPFVFGTTDVRQVGVRAAAVTAERALPPMASRLEWLALSDVASGLAIVVFALLSLSFRRRWAQWGTCAVGLWLLAAPLVFWSPSAAVYANDTLVGALAIAFSILVPMMPGMSMAAMADEADIPPGWDYSPSSWSQRLPIIALALLAFFVARYLAAYQLGHIARVWDPFFADGTRTVITSSVSRAWPVADAGLGALSYLLEALSGMMGGRRRWRTMPWMVAMFGVLVVPLGAISIGFIVIQPIVIGTWCSACLLSAAAMVLMLPYSLDEIVAMGQCLAQGRREGRRLWPMFWHGTTVQGAGTDRSPPLPLGKAPRVALRRQAQALPKGLVVSAAIGVWLMFTRLVFGHAGAMADSDHLVGALVFTVSVCAWAEVARPLRALNLCAGAWLLASPWLLDGASAAGTAGVMAAGAALMLLALPRGPVRHRYAGWDRVLRW